MSENIQCPSCKSEYTYSEKNKMICTQCLHEWIPSDEKETTENIATEKILDANGNELQNGDTVIVVKDLPFKGASKTLKAGTKVKNIRLTSGDHNIDCKTDGYGAMALKSIFVKKV